MAQFRISILIAIFFGWPINAYADMKEATAFLVQFCLAGGTAEQVEKEAKGDVSLSLKALRSGDFGAAGSGSVKYSKSDWVGLQGGINSGLTALQGEQADKARACFAPYLPGLFKAILESK